MPIKSGIAERYDSEAYKIRKRHNFPYDEPLNPYILADSLGIKVVEPNNVSGVSDEDLMAIQSLGADWSGLSFSLPDNQIIVILNPYIDEPRKRITLTEEICHFFCGHKAKVEVNLSGSQEMRFLDYARQNEKEAYGIAAATLVPYNALRSEILKEKNIEEMALYFQISPELVEYRLKITRLLNLYKEIQKVRKL